MSARRLRSRALVPTLALALLALAVPREGHADVSLGGWMANSPDDITGATTLTGNDATANVTLPFTFTIEGTNYTTVAISTNGWIEFGGNTSGNSDPTNDCLPTSAHTNPLVAPYWDDLNPFGTQVRYVTVGSSPNRVFLVDYEVDINTGEGSDDLRFQVQLHEGSNLITVRYRETQNQGNGQGATIGFQGAGGAAAAAHSVSCNAKVLDDNRPDEGWSADVGRAGRAVLASNTQHSPDDMSGFTTLTGNDSTVNVSLPFSVSIDGSSYSNLTLSTNGWIEFGGNTSGNSDPTEDCLPSSAHTNPLLAVYWDDMMTFGNGVRYQTIGSAGGRVFIADFEIETAAGGGAANDVRAQVMVHEGSSLISVRYRDIGSGVLGNGAVIGFQSAGGASSKGRPLTCNGRIIDDNDSIREGWSVDPRASAGVAVHGVMSHSPDDISGFTTMSGADQVTNVSLPFSVVIDGVSYSTVAVSTNGWLEFGGNTSGNSDPTNDCLPSSAHTNPLLAAFWDDLTPEGTNLRYGTVGTAPNRTFIVDAVSFITPSPDIANDSINYQVEVHEGSNTIITKYRTSQVQARGQTATIGFQRAGGGSAVSHAIGCNAPVLDDNRTDSGWSVTALPVCGNGLTEAAGGEVCDQGAANGTASSCCTSTCGFKPAATECRASAGVCDPAESCSGSSATCPADALEPNTTVCRAGSGDLCDPQESCTGSGAACPADVVAPGGTLCDAGSGDLCDPDETCTGVAGQACPADFLSTVGTLCRAGSGDLCDPSETCTGVADEACPADVVEPGTTVCNAGSGDLCDPHELCTGTPGVACPVDSVALVGTLCRAGSGDSCDPSEVCTGLADLACPADVIAPNTTVCNPGSGDVCDPDETCTGSPGQACPSDTVAPNTTVCNAGSGDVCDPDETCTGTADQACPSDTVAPNTTVCNPGSGDLCDPDETCTGTADQACPTDAISPSSTVCRAAADLCDAAESCTGNADEACPADVLEGTSTVCRSAAGECDLAESCDGVSAACPADAKAAAATTCTDDGNACTTDVCDGTGDACTHAAGNAGASCRASAGECDVAETCDGVSTDCPVDAKAAAATTCTDDGNACTTDVCDGTGDACTHPAGNAGASCRASAGECDLAETCDGVSTDCPADAKEPAATACTDDGNTCTTDVCDGTGDACTHPAGNAGASCRASAGECDLAETCDGVGTDCPADAKEAANTLCSDDANPCTADVCDGTGDLCTHDAGNAGEVCRPAAGSCDVDEACDGVSTTCPADSGLPDADSDTVCDAIDNCDAIANLTQDNNDSDPLGDACDPCTNLVPTVASKPKLTVNKLLLPSGDEKVGFSATFTAVPTSPALDPIANGVRFLLVDSTGAFPVDVTIPAGAYDPVEREGWRVNGSGTTFLYKNAGNPVPLINGINKILVKTYASTPGKVKINVKAKNGSYPIDVGNLPLTGTIVLAPPFAASGQCGEALFSAVPPARPSCVVAAGGKVVKCK